MPPVYRLSTVLFLKMWPVPNMRMASPKLSFHRLFSIRMFDVFVPVVIITSSVPVLKSWKVFPLIVQFAEGGSIVGCEEIASPPAGPSKMQFCIMV